MGHYRVSVALVGFSIIAVALGFHSAFADTETDSAYPSAHDKYSNWQIGKIDCSGHGGNLAGDGICDDWKVNPADGSGFIGLHIIFTDPNNPSVTYEYKLPCDPTATYRTNYTGLGVCPSKNHKDIYIELDWMKHHQISPVAINDTVRAFLNAPVTNPDNTTGIHLHIQYGENNSPPDGNMSMHINNVRIGSTVAGSVINYTVLKQNYFGTVAERNNNDPTNCPNNTVPPGITSGQQAYNCLTAKRQDFHYLEIANKIYSSTDSGWAETIGNDFFVSLGTFANGNGTIDEQEGTFMHELGHNLGLNHGGGAWTGTAENDDCKPNYLSVMSYTYIFRANKDVCRPLDFSNKALNTLNENNLHDNAVGSYPYPSINPPPPPGTEAGQPSSCPKNSERPIWYSRGTSIIQASTGTNGIDWDGNGQNTTSYTQNLNKLNLLGGCNTNTNSTLLGYNDWANLKYTFQNYTNFNGKPVAGGPGGSHPSIKGGGKEMGSLASTYEISCDAIGGCEDFSPYSPAVTVPQGGSGSSTITINSLNGFSSPISLTVSAPPGVTASVSPAYVTPSPDQTATSALSISVPSSTPMGSYNVTVTGASDTFSHSTTLSVTVANSDGQLVAFTLAIAAIGVVTGIGVWVAVRRRK